MLWLLPACLLLQSPALMATTALLDWPCQRAVVSRSSDQMPPFSFRDPQHKLTGYRIEFIQQLFARLGCDLEILTDLPWKRSLMLLKEGEVDVLMNASMSAQRAEFAWFSMPYEQEQLALFVKAGTQLPIKELPDIVRLGYQVGLIRGNHYGDTIHSLFQQPDTKSKIVEAIDRQSLGQLLLRGRIQLYLDYYPNGVLALQNTAQQQLIVQHPLPPQQIGQVYFMLSRHSVSPAFVRQLNKELSLMLQDGSIEKLRQKYALSLQVAD